MTLNPAITVLVIDDDEDDRFFIEQAFKRDSPDTQVYVAAGGQQAFDLLASVPQPLPDVILLDLNMPAMNGFDVLKHLKQSVAYQPIPVIVLTTSDLPDDQERARQLAAKGFVTKPNKLEELIEMAKWIRLTLSQ